MDYPERRAVHPKLRPDEEVHGPVERLDRNLVEPIDWDPAAHPALDGQLRAGVERSLPADGRPKNGAAGALSGRKENTP